MAAYVSCDASGQVAIIDIKNWRIDKLIDTGPGADGLAWARTDRVVPLHQALER